MSASTLASDSAPESVLPAPRAFGCSPDDLEIELGGRDRPAVTTRVIAQCCASRRPARTLELRGPARESRDGASLDSRLSRAEPQNSTAEELAWSLPLGVRIARLLRIVELTTENEALGVVLTCPHPNCRTRFEVSLPFAAIATEPEDVAAQKVIPFPVPQGGSLALRLPTGRDQAHWRSQPYASPADAVQAIVQTLAVSAPDVPADGCTAGSSSFAKATEDRPDSARHSTAGIDLTALSAAMEAADPLVAFSIRTTCPQCDQAAEIAVDLEAVSLSRLAQHRRWLLKTVHAFATRYGWSEAETLAIPSRRRSEYLRLIEDENPAQP